MPTLVMVIHFVSDWWLQPRAVAKRKTTNLWWMMKHLVVIYITWAVFGLIYGHPWWKAWVNVVAHGVQDKIIWGTFAYLRGPFDKEYLLYNKHSEDYWFYFAIALDQMIHLALLFKLYT